ncbi:MAG TPA: FKBP-type peptidyl-prolyl cis-trans isomerase [Solirubrobacterales bacterium]|nr:FKBP-type peptidyl-prolyl cis-trans isomerase [Solirubrobacterales bacterium]
MAPVWGLLLTAAVAATPPRPSHPAKRLPGEAKSGDEVTVQYVGVDCKTGEQFDASWDRGEPFSFTLGAGEAIPAGTRVWRG